MWQEKSVQKENSEDKPMVKGVAGTWKDLTDNVNSMAGNLTEQVRGIAKVWRQSRWRNLKRKLVVQAKGKIAALCRHDQRE